MDFFKSVIVEKSKYEEEWYTSFSCKNCSTQLNYIGFFDTSKGYRIGDLVIDNGVTKVYTGTAWEILGAIDSNNTEASKKIVPRICSQCGAPIQGYSNSCEYCGTRY